ncbi:hypothetical protein [Streptomyces xanthochromogenes]|uniref:hypothetical protein n=1 Tax=Streptomyces xanthochromogenes TaxID=67384 RepID=UPI00380BA7D2
MDLINVEDQAAAGHGARKVLKETLPQGIRQVRGLAHAAVIGVDGEVGAVGAVAYDAVSAGAVKDDGRLAFDSIDE